MTIVRPPLTYRVSWAPTTAAEQVANQRGMKEGDGTSYWDWLEEDEITLTKGCATFAEAVETAREKLPLDFCGQVRIVRLQTIVEDAKERDAEDAVWHLSEPDEALDEFQPEYEPEIVE